MLPGLNMATQAHCELTGRKVMVNLAHVPVAQLDRAFASFGYHGHPVRNHRDESAQIQGNLSRLVVAILSQARQTIGEAQRKTNRRGKVQRLYGQDLNALRRSRESPDHKRRS